MNNSLPIRGFSQDYCLVAYVWPGTAIVYEFDVDFIASLRVNKFYRFNKH